MKAVKYTSAKTQGAIHEEAMTRFDQTYSREKLSRELSQEDKIFDMGQGGQWLDQFWESTSGTGLANTNATDDRPRFQVNLASPVITKIIGEQRGTDIGPMVLPEGENASKEVAEVRQGLIRHIEKESYARDVYDNAYQEMLIGGYGGWQITTEHVDDDVFDQKVTIKAVKDATTSMFFGPAERYDKSDAPFCFLLATFDKSVYAAMFPKAEESDFTDEMSDIRPNEGWYTDDGVRLAIYYRKVSVRRKILQLSTGDVVYFDDVKDILDDMARGTPVLDEFGQQAIDQATGEFIFQNQITVVKQRTSDGFKIERYLLNGQSILDSNKEYKGKYFPLIPAFGETLTIGGTQLVHGKIRNTKDPARLFNFGISAIAEKAALGPADFVWMTPEQIAGHEADLRDMNTSRNAVQQYNALDENGEPLGGSPGAVQPPFPNQGPIVQQSLIQLVNDMRTNIYAVMGSSGQTTTDSTALDPRSGEAIKQGAIGMDSGSFLYMDNLLKSIHHSYTVINDLMGYIYDTDRQVQIIKPDETSDFVSINKVVLDEQSGTRVMINDMTAGSYGVNVKSGPSFATQRQESADGLLRLSEADPELRAVANDLIVGNMDGPGMEEMAKRLKTSKFQTGQLIPTEEEAEEYGIARDQAIIDQAKPQIEAEIMEGLQAQLLTAQIGSLNGQAANFQQSGESKMLDSQAKIMDSQAKMIKAESDAGHQSVRTNREAILANKDYLDSLVIQAQTLGLPITIIDEANRAGQEKLISATQFAIDPNLVGDAAMQQMKNLQEMIDIQQVASPSAGMAGVGSPADFLYDPQTGQIVANR